MKGVLFLGLCLGKVTCTGCEAQPHPGSGGLFHTDNGVLCKLLNHSILRKAAGLVTRRWGDERKMQNLPFGDGTICTHKAWTCAYVRPRPTNTCRRR